MFANMRIPLNIPVSLSLSLSLSLSQKMETEMENADEMENAESEGLLCIGQRTSGRDWKKSCKSSSTISR